MKPSKGRRECLNCKELFLPDYRNAQRQCYCRKGDCRKARKRQSQRAWLAKPENQNYFRDEKNAERVRNWQKEHPGYWKDTARYRQRTLQDDCQKQATALQKQDTQTIDNQANRLVSDLSHASEARVDALQKQDTQTIDNQANRLVSDLSHASAARVGAKQQLVENTPARTLQDLCSMQIPLFVGLISMFVGSTLPDDIAMSTRRLLIKGHDILGMAPGMNFERLLNEKTCPQPATAPENPASVQLD